MLGLQSTTLKVFDTVIETFKRISFSNTKYPNLPAFHSPLSNLLVVWSGRKTLLNFAKFLFSEIKLIR